MLTSITLRRFKRFMEAEIELGNPVVFIGPNNSGKTSALQALALWSIGIRKWVERREQGKATKKTGVTINRRELVNIPMLSSYALWREMRVRKVNQYIRIEIIVNGIFDNEMWSCGMEFESVDPENIRCRPIVQKEENDSPYRVPQGARDTKIAFLPPMSGLISQEDLLQPGSIDRRIGEGRTADVLRNLCYRVYTDAPSNWGLLKNKMQSLFGVSLLEPDYNSETGTLSLSYEEANGVHLDLTASGQGFRQTLLLLAYLYVNPNTVLLLDEPDAHLEILRQRQIYQTFVDVSVSQGNQILIATHSEIILNEAAQKDLVVAFIGQPHRMRKESHIFKALANYGFDHYYQAEQTGWVFYLEGSTDLAILQALVRILNHPAQEVLQRPFVHYVANQPPKAHEHFFSLREAFPTLAGIALFDRLERGLREVEGIAQIMWQRRELENYIAFPEVLLAFAQSGQPDDLFGMAEGQKRAELMRELIEQYIPPIALNNRNHVWWVNTKMSDDFLDPLFDDFYQRLGLPNEMRKSDYYRLADYIPSDLIEPEITDVLNKILQVASSAPSFVIPEPDDGGES